MAGGPLGGVRPRHYPWHVTPVGTLDAAALREAMRRFHESLREHRDELNSLNVYPVPDGDTGTNMLLTQQAVDAELARLDGGALSDVAGAIARSALMGARGNSGVILAQALRGLTSVVGSGEGMDAVTLARGLDLAAREARRAVARPVGGTILDVLADAAGAATKAAGRDGTLEDVSAAALEEARASLARTTEKLPELRRAGVVDAGAKGVVLLFDALLAALTGSGPSEPIGPLGPVGVSGRDHRALQPGTDFKFEVQYLLDTDDDEVPALQRRLVEIGDSLVVVGGAGTYRVHVHTDDPDRAIELAETVGTTSSVSVGDLEEDVERCLVGQARGVRSPDEQATALVAVADGEGLERVFSSLGAIVVRGGPGNNPSVGDLLQAVNAAPAAAVVILPDHENVLPAAERAAAESDKDVRVVRAVSAPQGVAAAAAFHPLERLEVNAEALSEAAAACSWGEVAIAVRDADTPSGPVRAGDALGIVEGQVAIVGEDAAVVAEEVVDRLRRARHEILTVFTGEGVTEEAAAAVESSLRRAYPDVEIEFHHGGQPGRPYLIALE